MTDMNEMGLTITGDARILKCPICGRMAARKGWLPAFRLPNAVVTNILTCPHCSADVQVDGACREELKKIRVYNAGPWFCRVERIAITKAFAILSADSELDVYSPLHTNALNVKAYENLPIDATREMYFAANAERSRIQRREVFMEDVRQAYHCDAMTVMIENWDQGTIFEMGLAYMRQYISVTRAHGLKRPILIAWSYEPMREANLMIQQSISAFTTDVTRLPRLIKENI